MSQQSAVKIELTQSDLSQEQLDFYLSKDIIAIDGEMMGLNIQRDRLCLIQIGDRDRNITLVKIEKGQKEAANLKTLMESEQVLKLFHFARTDLAFLQYWLGIQCQNIFCTKIASKLARTYTDKHSLREITKEMIGKEMSKTQQQTDWGSYNLSKEQANYAATDVYYLHQIYDELKGILEREGRLGLAQDCISFVKTLAELDILGYKEILEH